MLVKSAAFFRIEKMLWFGKLSTCPLSLSGQGGTTEYSAGILSYDIGLLRHLAAELADGAAGPERIRQIAGSIPLSR